MISLFLFEQEVFIGKFGKPKCLTGAPLSISLSLEWWFRHATVPCQVRLYTSVSYSRSRCRWHDAFCFMPLSWVPFKRAWHFLWGDTVFNCLYSAKLCNCLGWEFIFQASVLGSVFWTWSALFFGLRKVRFSSCELFRSMLNLLFEVLAL